jgi:hypothetical protein
MKRGALTFVLGTLALCAFLYVQPLLTIRVLAGALEESDTEAIRERMDAERVRYALKEQALIRLGGEGTPAADYAAGVASLTLFGRGIEMLLATRGVDDTPGAVSAEVGDWGFASLSRFHATLEPGAGAPFTLVLERQGTRWQVTAMEPSEQAWHELLRSRFGE